MTEAATMDEAMARGREVLVACRATVEVREFFDEGCHSMNWYYYVACFFAGLFLANAVPHFVKGVCGDRFPTPFSKPPGKGLSSPLVNVLWSLLNMLIGYVLLRAGRFWVGGDRAAAVFFAGVIGISVMASVLFAKKHTS